MRLILLIIFSFPLSIYCQWQKVGNGIPLGNYINVITSIDNVLFGNIDSDNGLYWSLDNGDNWTLRGSLTSDITYQNKLFRIKNDTICISLDSGLTFNSTNMIFNKTIIKNDTNLISRNYPNSNNIVNFHDTLVIASIGKYFISSDFGFTWHRYTYPSYFNTGPSRVLANDTALFYILNDGIANFNGCLSYQNNVGVWQYLYCTQQSHWPAINYIAGVMFVDSLIFIRSGVLTILHNNGIIETLFNNSSERPMSIEGYGDTLFLSTNKNVYKTNKSNYLSWSNITDGLPDNQSSNLSGYGLFIYKNYLFALSDSGLYRMELMPLTHIVETPHNFEMNIYPNPAQTQVNISVKQAMGKINIRVYTIYGSEVYAGILQNTETELSHAIDVSMWAKGLYIVKVSTNNGMKTTKLLME
ncbi:MAG: T9SS type A sorting domain-containing protein [Bacteroidales bacterium]|nr:T9SS type A sorting domain-containing protein [Bacteroidales bacterium]